MMGVSKFSGSPLVAVLGWLSSITANIDRCDIPEAAAWDIAEAYLTDEAHNSYTGNMDRGRDNDGGFYTWTGAVNFLLASYVTNANLNAAIERVNRATQNPKEPVLDFNKRLMDHALLLGGAFDHSELMNIFATGLVPSTLSSQTAKSSLASTAA